MTNALFPSVADFHPADLEARYGEHEDGQQEEAKNCNQGRGRVGTEGDQGERPPGRARGLALRPGGQCCGLQGSRVDP